MRIRGQIGPWPVDLEIELNAADWAQLAQHRSEPDNAAPAATCAPPAVRAQADDPRWSAAQQLLQRAGTLSGPQLLAELEPLAGGIEAAKRLLVRLRHCPQVRIEQQADAAVYRWIG